MSLQVWLPLNGDAYNRGLLTDFIQTSPPAYTDNGKIGKAMTSGAFKMTAEQTAKVLNNKAVSFCFWTYINADTGSTDNRSMFFGTDDMGVNNNRKFSIFNYPTVNDLHLSWMNDEPNTTFLRCIMSGVLPSREWTHVAITYDNPTCKVYINGILKGTYSGVSNSSSFEYETQLIYNASSRRLNDFRIYNHCLTAKEVSEIAKGLILHYPLSSQYETRIQNKYSGEVAAGKCISGNFTVTKLANERGYNYKLTYTGTGSNTWFACAFGNFSFTVGKKYYYSVKVRCHSKNFNIQLRASRSDNDWVTNMTNILNPDGKWHEYYVYQTINSTYDRAGYTVTCNPVLEFYSEDLSTADKVYSVDFDVKDVQVVESDCYVPFIENSYADNSVDDCSGYSNNGTRSGTLTYNSDSPRRTGCMSFEANSYVKLPKPITINNVSYFTISMWVMPKSGCGGYATVLSNFNYPANGFWIGINTEGVGTWFYNGEYAKGGSLLAIDEWSHIAMVFNAGTITWYVNGTAITTSNVTSRTTQFTDYIAIGNSYTGTSWNTNFVGKLSDIRFYSTALSADDIKELYNIPFSIDKEGNLYAYDYLEGDASNIYKTGTLENKEINENSVVNYIEEPYQGKSYSYIPSTSNNSCMTNIIVNYSNYTPGDKLYVKIDVEWSGFDETNTSGTFDIYFQGSQYSTSNNSFVWAGINYACAVLNAAQPLKNLVLSSPAGRKTIVGSFTSTTYPSEYSRAYIGIRSNYSNGTAKLTISNAEVIPEKYYINNNFQMGKNYMTANQIIEY